MYVWGESHVLMKSSLVEVKSVAKEEAVAALVTRRAKIEVVMNKLVCCQSPAT